MWKLMNILSRTLVNKSNYTSTKVRLFMSESFHLKDVWNKRLDSPILKRISINDLFYELDNQFQHFACANGLDIDLFVNAVNDDSNFDEIEDVVHKLRLSPEAISLLPSTHHGLIRLYMEWNKTDDLIRILDDRLNYGIFPDEYCSLLMMNTFIKNGNFRDAAKIATLSMLQEEVSNPLINYMCLYSCHKYLENPVPWNEEVTTQEDDDDEEVKVRVKFIRNPFFDDHFDLVDPNHLIGKTFTLIGSEIDDYVGRTYKLIGLLLHEKYAEAKNYIISLNSLKENPLLFEDGLTLVNGILDQKTNQNEKGKNDTILTLVKEVKDVLKTINKSQLDKEDHLLSTVEFRLKEIAHRNENLEINKQVQLYEEWEKNREYLLKQQIAKINKEKELAEIQRQKQLLKEKEDEIFFFEHEDKLDIIIEAKDKKEEEIRERLRLKAEANQPKRKLRVAVKVPDPPIESYFDENIPMKLVKTKL